MSDAPQVRTVQVGRHFAVDLEAIPGAGYMWEIAQLPAGLELVSQAVVSIPPEIGGTSTQRFLLVARQPGRYDLEFRLKRRWEKEPARKSHFSIQAE